MQSFLRNQLPLMLLSLLMAFAIYLAVSGRDMTPHDLVASVVIAEPAPSYLYVNPDEIPKTVTISVEVNTAQFKLLEGRKLTLSLSLDQVSAGLNSIPLNGETMLTPALPRGAQNPVFNPSEITVSASAFATRELPVLHTVYGALPSFLESAGPVELDRPTATVRAPEDRLASLSAVPTNPSINLADIRSNENSIRLTPNLPGLTTWLTVEPGSFAAHVPVRQIFVEGTFEIPIGLEGPPAFGPPLPVAFTPRLAKVTVSWPKVWTARDIPTEADLSLSLKLDAKTLSRSSPTTAPLEAATPPEVTVVRIDPPNVQVTWLTSQNYRRLVTN
ncbi:MAG: hypothetical protein LBO66_05675 [Deltaproteobacteria bacterium]|jgi:hypothetical protein|nr:hypothetical protein [Deltaproteobacteria bacterium]